MCGNSGTKPGIPQAGATCSRTVFASKRSFGEESTVTPLNATPSQLLGFTRHSTEHFRDKVCWPPLRLELGLKLDAWDKGAKAEYIA